MTFKEMNDKTEKESIKDMLTPMDKAGIIVGAVVNIGLIILYIVMKYC